MTEEQEPSAEYVKGFNQMYLISKDDPSIAKRLLHHLDGLGERQTGMRNGQAQHELELMTELRTSKKQLERDRTSFSPPDPQTDKDTELER